MDELCTVCGNRKRDDGTCPTCNGQPRGEFTISLFQSIGDTHPQMVKRTWAQLCAKFAAPVVRQEKDGLLFSPAKYSAPRRLIANVTELSLLVLEVDGGWQCASENLVPCNFKAPLTIFRNRRNANDKCPRCKGDKICQIDFDMAALVDDARAAFKSAFAIYSTHGHKRFTESNALAEPRFRIVVPLTEPIPVGRFLEVWQWAVDALKEIPADQQVKDPNRIYYTPVKFSADAPYEFHLEPGSFLNWRAVSGPSPLPARTNETQLGQEQSATALADSVSDGARGSSPTVREGSGQFLWHEDRHAELVKRIMDRGKQNSRGHYDAQCLAHGGKGKTGVCYFPKTGAVMCNKGCTYDELLIAEGLTPGHLPSSERAAMAPARVALRQYQPPAMGDGLLTTDDLNSVYSALLAHCFELTTMDEAAIIRHWPGADPRGVGGIEVPPVAGISDELGYVKICSMPSSLEATRAANQLAEAFDVNGVPGFYTDVMMPGDPSAESEYRRWLTREFGIWRIYLPYRTGLLVPYDKGTGKIVGLRVYRSVHDRNPVLLTSRGLTCGARAIPMGEAVAA